MALLSSFTYRVVPPPHPHPHTHTHHHCGDWVIVPMAAQAHEKGLLQRQLSITLFFVCWNQQLCLEAPAPTLVPHRGRDLPQCHLSQCSEVREHFFQDTDQESVRPWMQCYVFPILHAAMREAQHHVLPLKQGHRCPSLCTVVVESSAQPPFSFLSFHCRLQDRVMHRGWRRGWQWFS